MEHTDDFFMRGLRDTLVRETPDAALLELYRVYLAECERRGLDIPKNEPDHLGASNG